MTRTLRTASLAAITAIGLMGATAMSANASYLGYGAGDPMDENLWQEQGAEPLPTTAPHRTAQHAVVHRTAHHAAATQHHPAMSPAKKANGTY